MGVGAVAETLQTPLLIETNMPRSGMFILWGRIRLKSIWPLWPLIFICQHLRLQLKEFASVDEGMFLISLAVLPERKRRLCPVRIALAILTVRMMGGSRIIWSLPLANISVKFCSNWSTSWSKWSSWWNSRNDGRHSPPFASSNLNY
jgi:hypothetical protein